MGAALKLQFDEASGIAECGVCRAFKPLAAFHASARPGRRRTVQRSCAACETSRAKGRGEYRKAYVAANRDKVNAYNRDYYRHVTSKSPAHKARLSEYSRWYRRLRKYGITKEEFLRLHDAQAGKCAICDRPEGLNLRVDHNHSTGEVRGLLCAPCNSGLGQFHESLSHLNAAMRYLHERGTAKR